MIKKIDANKYGVVRYAISSIEDIADLPREVSVGSEAILVNEDGEKKFRFGSDGWVEVVEVKEYDEDKLRDMLEDAKVGYGGIEYETLEERLDKDFDNVYSVLDNRAYIEYEGCRIMAEDSLNGLQKETVIKGRTLQNLVDEYNYLPNQFFTSCYYKKGMIKPNTTYTSVIYNYSSELLQIYINEMSFNYKSITVEPNRYRVDKFQSKETVETNPHLFKNHITHELNLNYKVLFLEGDHTQTSLEELPFIEGIKSVGDKSKNLFDGKTRNGYYSAGEFKVNFSNLANVNPIEIKPNTYYIGSGDVQPRMTIYDSDMNFISYHSGTCLSPSNAKYMNIHANGATYFQVEEGTQATPYQEYYEGYKISGKSCGKNLFDGKIENGLLDTQTGLETVYNLALRTTEYIRVKGNTEYTASFNTDYVSQRTTSGNAYSRFFYYDTNKKFIGIDYATTSKITPSNCCYMRWIMYSQIHAPEVENVKQNLNLQIEEGQATPYEPYKETTYSYILDEPLRSLPNGICDEIDLEKGVVTRRVGKVVLDGSESWVEDPSEGTMRFAVYQGLPNAKNTVNRECIISDNFFDMSKGEHTFNGAFHYKTHLFLYKDLASASDFKQWLQANPTTVYYELANPITEYLIKEDKFVTLPNGVKDEISHNSVLRKVGKIVLDGSSDENWKVWNTSGENVYKFVIPMINLKLVGGNPLLCNNFKYLSSASTDEEGIYNGNTGGMGLKISKTKLTNGSIDDFREWLALNPITVWYELETPYTEPIDLNEVILNTTHLKSYEPITHITSDNYLLPTIKTQVPSDFNAVVLGLKSNNEALTSQVMSLRQTNDELETTNREQDDVIDVTLLALDEVYGMIDEGEIEAMSIGSPMVNVYVKMIKRGIKTLDEVPAKYRAEVEKLI